MNKKIALAMIILSASLTLTACTPRGGYQQQFIEFSSGKRTNTSSMSDNSEITNSTLNNEITDSNSSAVGGTPDIANYIEVTVSEDKYFYENHEILYDDLIKVFDELGENTADKISDENATLKAYESLTKALEGCGIMFETAS